MKRDDLDDVIREERSRGRKPVDAAAIKSHQERRNEVPRIFRRGTRDDLIALLKTWGYSSGEIAAILKEYDAALD